MTRFSAGDRVRLSGHFEFADGIVGTVTPPPSIIVELCPPGEWVDAQRTFIREGTTVVSYYVAFDDAHDDGSGDGPYRGAEIEEECLIALA